MSNPPIKLNGNVLDDGGGKRLINGHPMTATHVLHFETSIASIIDEDSAGGFESPLIPPTDDARPHPTRGDSSPGHRALRRPPDRRVFYAVTVHPRDLPLS